MSIPTPPAAQPQPPVPPSGNPPAPPTGYTPGMPMPPQTAAKKTNVLALIAMIVAIVGFVFACVPGALIVGWVLLPIAFVLSIVSLFLKGDRKWMGVVGLIVAVVGTIVGFVVFFAVVTSAVDDAFGSGETSVSQPLEQDAGTAADAEQATDADEQTDAAAEGTRENPSPLSSQISSDDWTVVVNSVNADGAAAVAEGNMFNDEAPAGSHYEIVNYTVTYTGDDKGLAAEVQVAMVTSAGNVLNSYDAMVVLQDGFGLDELYNGASATGSEAFLVPDGETVLIRVTPGMFADEVFVTP
ncbi:hypothetical protein [Microbacterium suwonense]|uniref:DUF4352 domain-containing protein n=1 Tax=Microbacterium suwonense TaxID=683047 RepID=A0ABN6X6E7_9MICO|nr:hypothetical protein [Microbacterium suwonense]BDZ39780.1 hypothetical protein GCM10025863_23940 [Microbacterium suwonense]